MIFSLVTRTLASADPKCVAKFMWNFGVKGSRSVMLFKKRMKKNGEYFPPFLYISVINSCNLRCQGCWVDVAGPKTAIDVDDLNRIITDAKKHGNTFFGLLGGEPFLYPELFDVLAAHPDAYFQVFTNGQFITKKRAAALRKMGNVTPLISIEGRKEVSDTRRGKSNVFTKSMQGIRNCLEAKLLTGVATSVCQSNIDELLTEEWLEELIDLGVHYTWFHTYRPVGPNVPVDLALTPDDAVRVREFVTSMRAKKPIAIIDAYYDADGKALCPMATGISHHIAPGGHIEPCPIIQFATDHINDNESLFETMTKSAYLKDFREATADTTRGCVVLENPDLVEKLAKKHGARDTTLRKTAMAELKAMTPRVSQYLPGREVKEKHWMYSLAKRFLFHDFGAYKEFNPEAWHVPEKTASKDAEDAEKPDEDAKKKSKEVVAA
ncbi:MAG: radical SAM protein [Verrucomicrobiota bacterium]